MSAPVYRDPVTDGAADPVVIRNVERGEWWMLTTQRRPDDEGPGVAWVHGSAIAVAVSPDGVQWEYRGTLPGLDPADAGPGQHTHWAPEVIRHDDGYHLWLSWIAGVPAEWGGHPRRIEHFTSDDLWNWRHEGRVDVGSDFVIDAAVARTPDGRWRLWGKDEAAGSSTFAAVSDDLVTWTREGIAIGGPPHEGPNVFELGGWQWMLTDEWRGQRVHRSRDGVEWERRGLVLDRPGAHPDDRQVGRHADAVVQGDHAVLFYFTHPGWDGFELADAGADAAADGAAGGAADGAARVAARRTAVHVARLTVVDDELLCDRDVEPLPLAAE
ncbi:family 43 glycosylhydrolase [Agromyces allii]|uniref:Glycosyl hydrolase n=1 Tax=Agromyces allii TaxID=393607 RepID=A0ABN2R0L4_9MICO|nr:family 43 glycosylhydrolase [Agromyces allii]